VEEPTDTAPLRRLGLGLALIVAITLLSPLLFDVLGHA
jgi:hypothetical protein